MSIASFERDVFGELKELLKKPRMKKTNFTEWRTTKFDPPQNEKIIWCPKNNVWASYTE
jgi:hypothetical protein